MSRFVRPCPASDDRVDRRLVIAHTDGSMEGGVRLSVAAPIEAVSTGGHPGGGGDGTRAAELGGANPRVIPEDNEHRGGGVGAIGSRSPPRCRSCVVISSARVDPRGEAFASDPDRLARFQPEAQQRHCQVDRLCQRF